jgi:hypothetical protein
VLSLTSGEVYRRGRHRSFSLTAAFVPLFCLQNGGYRSSKYPMGVVVMQEDYLFFLLFVIFVVFGVFV